MLEEDEGPVRKRRRLEKLVLDTLGIEELREYIDELKDGDRPGGGRHRPQARPSQRGGRLLQAAVRPPSITPRRKSRSPASGHTPS